MLPNYLPRPSTNSNYYLVQFRLRFYNLPRNRTQGTLLTYSVLGRPEIIAKKCQKVSMSQAAVAVKKTSDLTMTQRTLNHLLKRTTLTTKILKYLKVANVKPRQRKALRLQRKRQKQPLLQKKILPPRKLQPRKLQLRRLQLRRRLQPRKRRKIAPAQKMLKFQARSSKRRN